MKRQWRIAQVFVVMAGCSFFIFRALAEAVTNATDSSVQATNTLEQEIEQAIQAVQLAEQAVRQAMHDVEYSDPECSKLKAELVELERKVLNVRQQLYATIRASEAVREAEARRNEAAQRLQDLRRQQSQRAASAEPLP